VLPLVQKFLAERGLRLSPTKTTITHIDDGFDFLGQTLRKYNGKFLITPSEKKQKALLEKVQTIIKTEGRSLSAVGLINRLNPIIRGWANYHRHVVSKQVFQRIDYRIRQSLWKWAIRRHRNKSRGWVYRQYIRPPGAQKALFQALTTDKHGEKRLVHIYQASQTPIRRHIKVLEAANPYDPQWELYFEQRQHNKTLNEVRHRPDVFTLLRLQEGRCPVCANPSPWRPVGTTITSDGGYSAAVTNSITAFFSILLATNRSTALTIPVHRCVPYGAFEMLERLAGKLARAILRGGGGGNVASLPDPQTAQIKVVSPSLHYGGSTGIDDRSNLHGISWGSLDKCGRKSLQFHVERRDSTRITQTWGEPATGANGQRAQLLEGHPSMQGLGPSTAKKGGLTLPELCL